MLAGSIANAKLSNSSVTINSNALSLGGTLTLDTDDIGEGSSNLYYTDTRANTAIDNRVTNTFINNLTGVVADTSTALATARTISLSGDIAGSASFDGTSDITITSTIQPNSVALGTDTTGNYIQTITGTANKITVTGSGSESADVTLTLPDDVQVANNLTVAGNLTVNGTLTSLDTTNLDIEDNLFVLNAGLTGTPVNDSGMLINRGSSDNGIFMWDESADKFTLGLTTADGTSTGNITLSSLGTLVANLDGDVTGTVSSLSNHDTDDLAEGSNQYFTTARARSSISATGDISYNSSTGVISFTAGTGVTSVNTQTGAVVLDTDDISEGTTNQYFTTARARSSISASGDISYNSTTGVISFTASSSPVTSVNTQTGAVVLDSDDISEGSTNLYFTNARADARVNLQTGANLDLSSKSTSDLSEGTNLYYTDSRFDTRLGTKSTSDLSEGSNLYYTDARARAAISEDSTQLSYNSTTGVLSYTQGDTDTVSEGSTNLYYTDARVQAVSINNVVEDTTPQLGGDLASNGNDILFADNDKAIFGAGSDLQIYHNGTGSYVDEQGTGVLYIRGSAGVYIMKYDNTETLASFLHDDGVYLYHNNLEKFKTTSTGIEVTGKVELDNITIAGSQGTDGQVLTSTGSGIAWEDATGTGTTINNNANNRVITGSDTADTLEAESGLTYDGSNLGVTGTVNSMTIAASGFTCPTSQNFIINSPNGLRMNIDSNNTGTQENFTIGHNEANTGSNILFRINETGNASIGHGNSNAKLHIGSANATGDTTNPALQIGGASTYRLGMYTSTEGAVIENKNGDDGIQFRVKTAGEAMRIDGGTGAVIVGGTAALGNSTFTVDSDSAAISVFDSSAASGGYLQFRNNNTAKGLIGFGANSGANSTNDIILSSSSGNLQLTVAETSGAAVKLEFGNNDNTTRRIVRAYKDNFEPAAADTGVIGLGSPTSKFKDLYLSGGAYLGGTATGNHLDDYEEGTWTPSITFGQSSTGITHNVQQGKYLKVGRLVYVQCHCSLSSKGTASGVADVNGLPFAISVGSAGVFSPIGDRGKLNTGGQQVNAFLSAGGNSYLRLYENGFDGTGNTTVTNTNFANDTDIDVNIVYYTDS